MELSFVVDLFLYAHVYHCCYTCVCLLSAYDRYLVLTSAEESAADWEDEEYFGEYREDMVLHCDVVAMYSCLVVDIKAMYSFLKMLDRLQSACDPARITSIPMCVETCLKLPRPCGMSHCTCYCMGEELC